MGTQHVLVTSQAAVINTIKEWQIFDVPYLFSVDQANRALRGETGRKLLDLVDRQGVVGLSWLSVLERDVVSAKKPIMKLADLDGFKIRQARASSKLTRRSERIRCRCRMCHASPGSPQRSVVSTSCRFSLPKCLNSAFHDRPGPLDAVKRLDRSERS
jgi:hypothetical protein